MLEKMDKLQNKSNFQQLQRFNDIENLKKDILNLYKILKSYQIDLIKLKIIYLN